MTKIFSIFFIGFLNPIFHTRSKSMYLSFTTWHHDCFPCMSLYTLLASRTHEKKKILLRPHTPMSFGTILFQLIREILLLSKHPN
jgi:hypothetical protein